MDSAVHSALEEICSAAANGLHLRSLWPRLGPQLASEGLPLGPNVKRALWENLLEIPGLKLESSDGCALDSSKQDLVKRTVEECEKMNVKIVAPESMRKSFLGIYEMESSESGLSDIQRLILERLAVARTNGIAQSDLSKELHIAPNKLFYPLKRLETQGYIVRQPTVIRTKQASNREPNSESVTATNMLYLYRYGKHLGYHQRLEITKEDKLVMDGEVEDGHGETGIDFGEEISKEDVHVKDFLPALKAICDKLEKAQGKVLVVSDIKQDLGYRGTHGHRAWRNMCHKLKVARVVEECCTIINKKVVLEYDLHYIGGCEALGDELSSESHVAYDNYVFHSLIAGIFHFQEVNCLRLISSFSPSYFEPKLHGHGNDDTDPEQSKTSMKRGQITEQLLELPLLRQVYDMVDAAGAKGLTNTEISITLFKQVCRRLGLCSKEYHRRYFKQMISRFGLHLQLEPHNRNEVYRLWTAGNFNPGSSNMAPAEEETALKVNESGPSSLDLESHEDLSQPVKVIDDSISMENVGGINKSEKEAVDIADASNVTNMDKECSSTLLLQCSTQNSGMELSGGVPDQELFPARNSVNNNNMVETCSLAVVALAPPSTPTPSRRRSNPRYPRLIMGATNSQREQNILKLLQEEKFLIKPELHRRLESLENLGKEKNTTMDRKTLLRCLNKLQGEGHCKCIHVSVPDVTNYGRSKAVEVILHSSFQTVSPELLAQIHDKIRSFEIQVRRQAHTRQKGQSVPILDNVERIPNSIRSDTQLLRAEAVRNGFVLPRMVRTKLLHVFLWDWMHGSPSWDGTLLPSNHSNDLKNPHSTCKLFELDLAIRSMPLALFLKVVGSAQALEDMIGKCRSGMRLCDLPIEEYKILMDTRATGRLSWLIDILRRLKLIRLVSKDHAEDGGSNPHTTLTHALELKPYIEEPVTGIASTTGLGLHDLRPQIRHDFVLLSRKAVDEYWNTLEYCYSASKSRAALLAFPGTAVHEVFNPRSWTSSRVITADERVELHKRVVKDDPKEKLSFSECEKIAKDLNLTLEQVLRVYSDKRQQRLTRLQRDLAAENQNPGTDKEKDSFSSCKNKRSSSRMPSKLVTASLAVGESSLERSSPIFEADDKTNGPDVPYLNEDDKTIHTFIHKQALANFNVAHKKKKFMWTEEADRRLVIEYARYRAALGAKYHRVDWASVPNLPAPPNTCKRRMAVLNSYMPFRKAVMKLCNMLAERYSKYLAQRHDKILDDGDFIKMTNDPSVVENHLKSSTTVSEEWANFDEDVIKLMVNEVLRHKRMSKLEVPQDTFPDQENSEDSHIWLHITPDSILFLREVVLLRHTIFCILKGPSRENEGCERPNASGQRSRSRKPPVKYMKLSNDYGSVCRQMHESVAVANAAELFKLIFLSNSKAPEVPILLAETLRRYSEHDLFAAFNYLREKKIMIGGSSNAPFVLSQHFMQSISRSTFPDDTGKRAADFLTWLHEREEDLMEEGIDVPSDLQCGEVFTLCTLISSRELSITPCLPDDGVGEVEDNRTSKRKCDDNDMDSGEISKKLKTSFTGEGEMTSRREKGFPGIKLCLQRESFKVEDVHRVPLFGEKNQGIQMDANCGASDSDVADYVREMLDSGRTTHRVLDVGESPWESMTRYAEYLTSSCSYERESSTLKPDLFKNLYSAIHKSGDNGLSMKNVRKVLNIKDEKMLELIIEVLEAFGRTLKVNGYDSIRVVDSLYQSKYFLNSVRGRVSMCLKHQKTKFEDECVPLDIDNQGESVSPLESEINTSADEEHRVTILNLPEDVSGPSAVLSTSDNITSYQHSDSASPIITGAENFGFHSVDARLCRPLLPWMNGDGTINEPVYKGLIRRVLGIVMQNPGILEDDIIKHMQGLNPQSCKRLLEIMILDNHIITRKMQQKTSSQPPSILGNLLGDRFRKSKLICRVHYFANPMSTTLL
ncbi:B-block binding subunit of TFIIIC [Striga asiatica]|uniref:B-block binding subunit of TFIIIC n=1 Tax=Striga asiatica TaxID=4170 RepID=A0A5A7R759_STRAF|nr:B-block binding subunit of TFIIIC [Striga asiatica]